MACVRSHEFAEHIKKVAILADFPVESLRACVAKINGSGGMNDAARKCKRVGAVTDLLGLPPRSSIGGLVLFASLIVIAGCGSPAQFLNARDSEIKDSTKALETARDDRQRAKAYSSRGTAYSEKARYSRISKLIPNDEYERLFGLAMEDHN